MQQALWTDWQGDFEKKISDDIHRLYLGHESCQYKLPRMEDLDMLAEKLSVCRRPLTFVTPCLNSRKLGNVLDLVTSLSLRLMDFEVVCNDWGLLFELAAFKTVQPVMGRFLCGQFTDPRFSRILNNSPISSKATVRHLDGTLCNIIRQKPSDLFVKHVKSVSLDRYEVFEFFNSMGIRRCEISAVPQGIQLSDQCRWKFSLHNNVPLASFRWCPEYIDNCIQENNSSCNRHIYQQWQLPQNNNNCRQNIYRMDNAVYCQGKGISGIDLQANVDRVVTFQ